MINHLSVVTLIVKDQQEALRFYTEKLGLEERANNSMGKWGRWITVAPKGDSTVEIVLQPTDWFEGEERISKEEQVGKNPPMVFAVTNCQKAFEELQSRGVQFSTPPASTAWGIQAVAADLYGNTLVLLERSTN